MNGKLWVNAATRLPRTVIMTALAVGFAAGFAVLTASAEPSDRADSAGGGDSAQHGARGGEPAHVCPHAKAAGAAAAPCDHAADGSCANCSDATDCPHAKDGSCSECGGKEQAPETH